MSLLERFYPGDGAALLAANVLAQLTVLLGLAGLLAKAGSRWGAAWRHGVWLAALGCALASPLLACALQAAGLTLFTLAPPAPSPVPALDTPALPEAAVAVSDVEALSPREGIPRTLPVPRTASDVVVVEAAGINEAAWDWGQPLRALGGLAAVAWSLGTAFLALRWLHGLRLAVRLRRSASGTGPFFGERTGSANQTLAENMDLSPSASVSPASLLEDVRQALGTTRLPRIAASPLVDRPVVVGLLRPVVILPEGLLSVPLDQSGLKDVLVHECAHAVRRDHLVGLLQRLAGTLFWPHPLVFWMNGELARAREEICDNYVLRGGSAADYARMLFALAQGTQGVSLKPAVLGLFHPRWRLEDRIAGLLDPRRKTMIRVNRWTAGVLVTLFLALAVVVASVCVLQADEQPQGSSPRREEVAVKKDTKKDERAKQEVDPYSQLKEMDPYSQSKRKTKAPTVVAPGAADIGTGFVPQGAMARGGPGTTGRYDPTMTIHSTSVPRTPVEPIPVLAADGKPAPYRTVHTLKSIYAPDLAATLTQVLRAQPPRSATADTLSIVPEPVTNSLILSGPKDAVEEVRRLAEQLDRPAFMVELEAVIAEVPGGEAKPLADKGESGAAAGLRPIAPPKGMKALSRVRVTTLNNQEAAVVIGQQQPRVMAATLTPTGRAASSVSYMDTGTTLRIVPRINPDKTVILLVDVESMLMAPSEEGAVISVSKEGEPIRAPVIRKVTARTTLRIPDGQPVYLGGQSTESGKELIIQITPRVMAVGAASKAD